jgi:hypothetical protein
LTLPLSITTLRKVQDHFTGQFLINCWIFFSTSTFYLRLSFPSSFFHTIAAF